MYQPLKMNTNPLVDMSAYKNTYHLRKEIYSYFPAPKHSRSRVLDIGCDMMQHSELCRLAGFNYVGIDNNPNTCGIRADAHNLPFDDNEFEFILSIAVLEHLHDRYRNSRSI